MINVQQYIETGVLGEYCLGLLNDQERAEVERMSKLYPEVGRELEAVQRSLDGYALSHSGLASSVVKEKIWAGLEAVSAEQPDISLLPLLSPFSDYQQWLQWVKPLLPAALPEPVFTRVLQENAEMMQAVIWTNYGYPDEVHDDLQECFMILEGECECVVGDKVIRLKAGDFFEVPMHVHHDVKAITPEVIAIVQRRKAA